MVCATSKASDQPAHRRRLIRAAFASRLHIQWVLISFGASKLKRRLHRLVWVYTFLNVTLLKITCHGSYIFSFPFTGKFKLDACAVRWMQERYVLDLFCIIYCCCYFAFAYVADQRQHFFVLLLCYQSVHRQQCATCKKNMCLLP